MKKYATRWLTKSHRRFRTQQRAQNRMVRLKARYSDQTSSSRSSLIRLESEAILADYLDSVKSMAANYRTWARSSVHDKPDVAERHTRSAMNLESVIEELEAARRRLTPLPTSYGDISDLPAEVLAELSLTKIDELEQQLRDIVASGDDVGLDPIIIELYRRHKIVHPRRFVMNKLYRMGQKGIIDAVEGKKGVYRVRKPWTAPKSAFDSDLDDDVPF